MLGKGFSHSLGQTLGRVLARGASSISYVKDNLKAYFDFKNTDLEHVGTGSANISTPSDGSGDWIEYTDATLLDAMEGIDTLTIMAWVRRDDNTGFAFITKGGYYGSNTDWGSEWQGSNGRMRFSIEQNFTAWEPPPDTYINTWVHYAITYDKNAEGSNIHRVVNTYYNGDQDYGYGSGTPATVGTNGNNIRIGATSTGVGPLRGNIKNVGIWNRVLSKEEIRNVMYKSYSDLKGSELTNLQLWADLDTDFNGKDGNGRTITGSAAGNANIMQNLYGNNLPIMPRGVDNSKAALADQIGSGSASFDGDDDYITAAGTFPDDDYTITAWFKTTDVDQAQGIVSWGDEANYERRAMIIYNGGGGTDWDLVASIYNENIQGGTTITENKWHHGAITVNKGTKAYSIYLDGALETSGTFTNSLVAFTGTTLYIGRTGTGEYFEGNIAQVGVFNAVLTQEQIQSIKEKTYSDLSASEKTNLVSWWGLDSVITGSTFDLTAGGRYQGKNHNTVPCETAPVGNNETYGSYISTWGNSSGSGSFYGWSDFTAGQSYQIDITLTLDSGTAPTLFVGTSNTGNTDTFGQSEVTTGSYQFDAVAGSNYLGFHWGSGVTGQITITSFSVKNLLVEDKHGSNNGTIS